MEIFIVRFDVCFIHENNSYQGYEITILKIIHVINCTFSYMCMCADVHTHTHTHAHTNVSVVKT